MVAGWQTAEMTAEQCLKRQVEEITRVIGDEFKTRGVELTCHQSGARKYPKKYRERHNETKWVHAAICIELRST